MFPLSTAVLLENLLPHHQASFMRADPSALPAWSNPLPKPPVQQTCPRPEQFGRLERNPSHRSGASPLFLLDPRRLTLQLSIATVVDLIYGGRNARAVIGDQRNHTHAAETIRVFPESFDMFLF